MKVNHCIVFDPIPYHGGSKVATLLAMQQTERHTHYHVLSASTGSWTELQNSALSTTSLLLPKWIATFIQGKGYWLKQAFLSMYLLVFTLSVWLINSTKPTTVLLASGPGVDFAGYVIAKLLHLRLIQLIHGPVGKSSSSKHCLLQGHATFYLHSAKPSLLHCLGRFENDDLPRHFMPFVNGLDERHYPTAHDFSHHSSSVQFYWAASLLKWKGLDCLLQALKIANLDAKHSTQICYIKPKDSVAEQSAIDKSIDGIIWHQQPANLDSIRARSNVYISTSINEPFGLSTLEALVAGLLVIIPRDGAFWDLNLQEGVHCMKYIANDPISLSATLQKIVANPFGYQMMACKGKQIASHYQAKQTYAQIANCISDNLNLAAKTHFQREQSLHKTALQQHKQTQDSAQHLGER